jgi:hypothetical protein
VERAVQAAEPARSRRFALAALWLAVLATVVFLPEAYTRWFLPKDALFAVAAVAASLSLGRGRLPRWLLVCAGAGILLLLVGVAFSASPWASFWGRWPRYEGAVSLSAYLVAVWAGARLLGPGAGLGRLRAFLSALSVASILLGVVGLLETVGIDPIPTPWERPGSLAGNATDQGILGLVLLAVLALPAVSAWRHEPLGHRLLLTAGALAALATVAVSASRAAFLGAVVVVLALAVFQVAGLVVAARHTAGADAERHRRRIGRGLLIAVGTLVLLVGVALAVPLTRNRLLGLSPLSMTTVSDRVLMWQEALAILLGRPLTGVGPSGFVDAVPAFWGDAWYESVGADTVLDSPHNLLLQTALAGGLPLLLVLVVTGLLVVVTGWRRWSATVTEIAASVAVAEPVRAESLRALVLAGSVAGLLGTAAALLTTYTAPATALIACLLVGVVVAAPVRSRPAPAGAGTAAGAAARSAARPARILRTVVVALWAAWLVLNAGAELPLQRAEDAAAAGRIAAADEEYGLAQALRPWDADIASIAARELAAVAQRDGRGGEGDGADYDGSVYDGAAGPGATEPGTRPIGPDPLDDETRLTAASMAARWAERALDRVPDSVPTLKALAGALEVLGEEERREAVLDRLARLAPNDPDVAELRS